MHETTPPPSKKTSEVMLEKLNNLQAPKNPNNSKHLRSYQHILIVGTMLIRQQHYQNNQIENVQFANNVSTTNARVPIKRLNLSYNHILFTLFITISGFSSLKIIKINELQLRNDFYFSKNSFANVNHT
jgi:hypothetical protein